MLSNKYNTHNFSPENAPSDALQYRWAVEVQIYYGMCFNKENNNANNNYF